MYWGNSKRRHVHLSRGAAQIGRFFSGVEKTESCWMWKRSVDGAGYGKIFIDGKRVTAHRYSWTIHRGAIPDGLCVLHHCDVRRCVNPDHLFIGTKKDNMQDALSKDRLYLHSKVNRSDRKVYSKLSECDVLRIRELADTETHAAIALQYAISQSHVGSIVYRTAWRHI